VLVAAGGEGISGDCSGDLRPAHLTLPVRPVVEAPQGVSHPGEIGLEECQLGEISVAIEHPATLTCERD
jgi:hypothetical protein